MVRGKVRNCIQILIILVDCGRIVPTRLLDYGEVAVVGVVKVPAMVNVDVWSTVGRGGVRWVHETGDVRSLGGWGVVLGEMSVWEGKVVVGWGGGHAKGDGEHCVRGG